MPVRHHHWLTRLYPTAWRERYGDELDALIEDEGDSWHTILDLAKAALTEHLHPFRAGVKAMQTYPGSVAALARKPSAMVPIFMSAAALSVVVAALVFFGARSEPDEGAAAHIFQFLIAGQLPFLGWFAAHWLKRDMKGALTVIAGQVAAIAIALLPVWYFGL